VASGQHDEISGQERVPLKVLVTGASGFIGSQLVPLLVARGHQVVAASRAPVELAGAQWRLSPGLGCGSDWSRTLQGAEVVVHLAGRAQIGPDSESEESLCRRTNTEGTARLARQAGESGVRHFVFLSSVHAVAAESDEMVTAETVPHPLSAYGRSKLAAEEAVGQELQGTGCAWTILRPPAVYGRGQSSNFGQLAKLAASGIPLPFASVHNRRSFLYVENLVDVIVACVGNPRSFGRVFLPSDGEDVSTPELIRKIAKTETGTGGEAGDGPKANLKPECIDGGCIAPRGARLFLFPESLLKAAGRLPGLGALRKLTSSLYVDSEPLRRDLGWKPPFNINEGLRRTFG
jgi:nucleoside-diphosphate-sugar epimerase